MKKQYVNALCGVAFALLGTMAAQAYDFEVDGIGYTITSFTEFTAIASAVSEGTTGSLAIPSSVSFNGKKLTVTDVGEKFAQNNTFITEILIAPSITTIGSQAFEGCSKLVVFTGDGITTIGSAAFKGCSSLKNISLPLLSKISTNAFQNCISLDSFDVPANVNSIGDAAFSGCTQLEKFIIPDHVNSLGYDVFSGCTALRSVIIGQGINALYWIFEGCNNLETLIIEDSEMSLTIGNPGTLNRDRFEEPYTIYKCPSESFFSRVNLKEVYIGRNLVVQDYYESVGYKKYNNYYPNPPFSNSKITKVTIGPLVSRLSNYSDDEWDGTFENCTQLSNIVIEGDLENIPAKAFYNCSNLKNIKMPRSIESVGEKAFSGCSILDAISLGGHLTTIGNNAFNDCSSLKSITLFSATPPIYETGFWNDVYINTSINIPLGAYEAYKEAEPWKNFWNINEHKDLIFQFELDGVKYEVVSEKNVSVIDGVQCQRSNLVISEKVTFLDYEFTVTDIADCAFYGCDALAQITLPPSVTKIGDECFYNCTSLDSIAIPSGLECIGNKAFFGCDSLSKITLPPTVIKIGDECFRYCNFSTFSVPASVETIGSNAFASCNKLYELIIEPGTSTLTIPYGGGGRYSHMVSSEGYSVSHYSSYFSNLPIEKLYIGRDLSAISRYSFIEGGKDYFDRIYIYDSPFHQLKNLKELIIGENVSVLGSGTERVPYVGNIYSDSFGECTTLKTVSVLTSTPPEGADFSSTTYTNGILVVPIGAIPAYQEAIGWKDFAKIIDSSIVLPEEIALDTTSCLLAEGDTIRIKATVLPEDAIDKTIIWASSDEDVVTVSEVGLVEAISSGTACVTATCGWITAICNVTVKPKVNDIELNDTSLILTKGNTFLLEATVLPENAIDKTVIWASSNEEVATVSNAGLVEAVGVGTATITATCGDVTATCEVTVKPAPSSIKLNYNSFTLGEGENFQLEATVLPEDAIDKTVTWSTSNYNVATVSVTGLVKANKAGTATITAKCGKVTATCKVTVEAVAREIELNEYSITLCDRSYFSSWDNEFQLEATVLPEDAYDKTVTWSSSNNNVATVSETGFVEGVEAGTATITAKCGKVSSACRVTVKPGVSRIELNEEFVTLFVGETFQLRATVYPENAFYKEISWSVQNYTSNGVKYDAATVSETGLVRATKVGHAYIEARCGGMPELCFVTVTDNTGLETLLQDSDAEFAVYNVQGILVQQKCTPDELRNLPKGIYILSSEKGNTK